MAETAAEAMMLTIGLTKQYNVKKVIELEESAQFTKRFNAYKETSLPEFSAGWFLITGRISVLFCK